MRVLVLEFAFHLSFVAMLLAGVSVLGLASLYGAIIEQAYIWMGN